MDMRINHGALDTAVADIDAGLKQITSRLEQLDGELRQLSTNWEGNAKQAYDVARADWNAGMEGLNEILNALSVSVANANATYQQMDHRNAGRFGA